jgi:beta-galactosidase
MRSMRHWFYNSVFVLVFSAAFGQGPNDHIFPAAPAARRSIDFDSRGFLVNGQRTFLVSAGMEYARVPRALWADRLLRLKRAGFNCVEVYTFWNFHEPREGVFDFTGDHDLGAFLRLVHSMGLYAIVRVGPYYCAEWDNGGYPLWLKFKPGVRVREPNAAFESAAGAFFDRLLPIVAANQVNHGGAVILVQLENEHPLGWGTAMPNAYFRWLRSVALAHGIEVPYFFSGLHHDNDPAGEALNLDDPGRPNPWMTTEFWSVWYNGYGSGSAEARLYERRTWKIIAHGGNGYNYYMAHGGSNFGYTNNDEDAASYDYGAAVGQGGDLRPIYYSFKRAALFARSFASVLENSTGDMVRGLVVGDSVRVNERRGPAGEIVFLDNTSSSRARVVLGGDTVLLSPGEIFPYVRRFGTLKGNTLRILGVFSRTLVVYGEAGSSGQLHFSSGDLSVTVGATVGTYRVGGLRVLVMSREMADRTWIVDDKIICGPAYVGAFAAGRMETEGDGEALVFTANDVTKYIGAGPFRGMERSAVVEGWHRYSGSAAAVPGYDDGHWKRSEWPLQMGADGDTTADAWYRVPLTVDRTGDYTLLVEGADRARAFLDGVPLGPVAIKDGVIPLRLTRGRHLLAAFTAHDGRDKLPAYLGPIDSVARKGLYGRALLVRGAPAVTVLSGWRFRKDSLLAWKPYTIGEDAFDKKPGHGWFQTMLPALPAGARQAELRFASVDENATVYVNGRLLVHHDGWNAPFNVRIDRMDTFTRPVVLTVFVENYSNEGGIDQPVRFSPWVEPVEVRGWKMKGGPSVMGAVADTAGPCWWRASFTVPADSGFRVVWRVIPTGLGHGSIWVNGHNLGRYPEKIPVNGLYIPDCWLHSGGNALLIYDEDGRDARQVTVEAEVGASRRVSTLMRSPEYGFVDPFIGTTKSAVYTRWGDEGGTYPGAVAVSGHVQLTPETRRVPSRGYDYRDTTIYTFSCWDHHSGFPGGSAGRLLVIPVLGGLHARPFLHRDEVAEPGYYRVRFADDGTVVEAAAAPMAGIFRISFGGERHEVFVGDTAGMRVIFSVAAIGSREVEGGTIYSFASKVVRIGIGAMVDFDSLRVATRRAWEGALSVVAVEDDDARRKAVLYTALYHSLLLPWVVGSGGEYGGFSPWDSFRSLHPLLTLLYPEKQAGVLRSLMAQYHRTGYLPTESMTGDHSIPILVDAWLKGVRGGDRNEVYAAMLRSLVRGPFLQADRKVFLDSGYIPFKFPESVTRTVEYGYDDWVLAQYARMVMGDTLLYRRLMRSGMAYRRLLYVPSLLLLPRDGDSFRERPGNTGYKEGDAWAYTYFAPQDIPGLIARMGGPAFFSLRLDSALRDGRIVFDNETVEHVPYLFAYAGRGDLTQYWVRKIMDDRYSDQPGGLPGNDDLGALSSWYVFSALGFYPVCPGWPYYTLGVPVFRRVVVHLAGGDRLVITGGEGRYVRSVSLNGRELGMEVPHRLMAQGGLLSFGMSDMPPPRRVSKQRFLLMAVSVSRQQLVSGEWGWVRYTIKNTGDTGVMHVGVVMGGKEVGFKNELVAAGTVMRDSVAFRVYPLGKVELMVGDELAGVEVIKPERALPIEPLTEELRVRAVVRRGDSTAVGYTLKNTGWEKLVYRLPLLVDTAVVGFDSVSLEPGEVRERSWVWKASVSGWHEWKVGGLARRCRVYEAPDEAVVLDGGTVVGDTVMRDESGWGNTIHVVGGPDPYLWVGRSRSLDDLGERLTMCVWVYPDTVKQGLVDIFTNGDTHVLQIGDGKTLTFFAGGWGRGDCTVDLPADWLRHWHLLTGVCDLTGLKVYIDGQLRGTTPLEKGVHLFGGGNTWMVGRNEEFPGERIFTGRVARPRIYQSALSADIIYHLFIKEREQP